MFRQFYRMGNREGYEVEDLNEMKQFGYPRGENFALLLLLYPTTLKISKMWDKS